MPVTREDCQALLDEKARRYGPIWIISGCPFGQEDALKIAELCIRSGRELTAVIDTDWALSVARRLDALEERVGKAFSLGALLPREPSVIRIPVNALDAHLEGFHGEGCAPLHKALLSGISIAEDQ